MSQDLIGSLPFLSDDSLVELLWTARLDGDEQALSILSEELHDREL